MRADTEPLTGGVNTFCREGDFWTMSFAGHTSRVKHAKGLGYVARLLASPDREVHALDLAQPDRVPIGRNSSHAYDVLDEEGREVYKARIEELEDEIDAATAVGDIVAAERAGTERDAIAAELTSAYGLGGRARRMPGDPAERARKAVGERIRATISRIEKIHPALGRHLRRSIRTGTFCAYEPEEAIAWDLRDTAPSVHGVSPIRVMIVDDHALWRETLGNALGHRGLVVVADAKDATAALEAAARHRPDVVLMDMDLPGMRGPAATSALADVCPESKVLVLSSHDERDGVLEAVAAGADGYLLKTADASEIVDAVRRINAGELVFPPPLSRVVLAELRKPAGNA